MTTHNTAGRAVAIAALALAGSLLGLQIVGGLEYTHGGSFYTQASMIAAMITLAALPVFIEAARRHRHAGSATALGIAFVAFLAYSLPATTGRTGEIKEVKAKTASDLAQKKVDLAKVTAQIDEKKPAELAECAGAPVPLPPSGWPKCRTLMGEVSVLEAKQLDLKGDLKGTTNDQLGDMGSDLWAWALSLIGFKVEAATIRKISIIAFAVGLDLAIWPLVAFGSAVLQTTAEIEPAKSEPTQLGSVTDAELFALKQQFGDEQPNGSPNPPRDGGSKAPNRKPNGPKPNGSRFTKEEAAADLVTRLALGERFGSQDELRERYGVAKSTMSEWLTEWTDEGIIPARTVRGRCKVLAN